MKYIHYNQIMHKFRNKPSAAIGKTFQRMRYKYYQHFLLLHLKDTDCLSCYSDEICNNKEYCFVHNEIILTATLWMGWDVDEHENQ